MSERYNLVYMGTPDFSVGALDAIIGAGHRVSLVFTQPDRPAGRGGKLRASPVKIRAQELGLEICQPTTLKGEKGAEARALLQSVEPDALIVAAYGLILPQSVLDIPRLGALNIHASLLPRWRGASPIQAAIKAGDSKTGVTIMKMDAGLDTGPMLLKREIDIAPDATAGTLHDELAALGADLAVEVLDDAARFLAGAEPQPDESTYAPMLKKSDGRVDWHLSAIALHNHIRAMTPWPGAQSVLAGVPVRIIETSLSYDNSLGGQRTCSPGEIVGFEGESALVAAGDGFVKIVEVQPAGKRPMPVARFFQGRRLELPQSFVNIAS